MRGLLRLLRAQAALLIVLAFAWTKESVTSGSVKSSSTATWVGGTGKGAKPAEGDEILLPAGTEAVEWNSAVRLRAFDSEAGTNVTGGGTVLKVGDSTGGSNANIGLRIAGSFSYNGTIELKSTAAAFQIIDITPTIAGPIQTDANGKYQLARALKVQKITTAVSNSWKTEGFAVDTQQVSWGEKLTLESGGSTFTLSLSATFVGEGWTFVGSVVTALTGSPSVVFTGAAGAHAVTFDGKSQAYNLVQFGAWSEVEGSNTISTLAVNGKGAAEGKGVLVEAGSVQSVTAITTTGTKASPARLESKTPGSRFAVKGQGANKKVTGTLIVKDVEYTGGGTLYIECGGSAEAQKEAEEKSSNFANIVFGPEPGGTEPAIIPLSPAASSSSASMGLAAPTAIPLAAASSESAATTSLTAATAIPLAPAGSASAASAAVSAPTQSPLQAASAASAASAAVNAPTQTPLAAAASTSGATMSMTAPTQVPLSAASSTSSGSLTVSTRIFVPLQPASSTSSAQCTVTFGASAPPEFGRMITGRATGPSVGLAGAVGARQGSATGVTTGAAGPTTEREGP